MKTEPRAIQAIELIDAPMPLSTRVDTPPPSAVRWIKSLFGKVDATAVLREQHFEARRLAVEHAAAAEFHSCLADMYGRQSLRVGALLDEVA